MLSEAPFTVIIQLLLECCQEKNPHCFLKMAPASLPLSVGYSVSSSKIPITMD